MDTYNTPNDIFIVEDSQKRNLTENEIAIFNQAKNILNDNLNTNIKILYRGEKKSNLMYRLNTHNQDKIFDKLFIVGEKASNYYKDNGMNNTNSDTRDYMLDINDISNNTFSYIFNAIEDNLNNNGDESNEDSAFENYFLDENNKEFFLNKISELTDKNKLRIKDYYYAYLHTCNEIVNNFSHYTSTSLCSELAWSFTGSESNDKIMFHFILKKPYLDFAIYSRNQGHLKTLCNSINLPIYEARYDHENEISIKGGLLPHFIFGMEYIENNEKKFIVNPYLFENDYDINNIITKGFPINEEYFEETIKTTNYNKISTVYDDGRFEQTSV